MFVRDGVDGATRLRGVGVGGDRWRRGKTDKRRHGRGWSDGGSRRGTRVMNGVIVGSALLETRDAR